MLGFFGAILGGVGLSVLTFTYHAIFYPDLVGEDNYFVHYLLTGPVGACLGAGAIFGLTLKQTEPRRAGRAYLFGVLAATIVCAGLAYWQGLRLLTTLLAAMLFYLPVSLAYFWCLMSGVITLLIPQKPQKPVIKIILPPAKTEIENATKKYEENHDETK
jgi:hypothetical protein